MKSLTGVVLLIVAAMVHAAETYKWVDEKGVVNYAEKPPANRPSRPVSTEPTGVIETSGQHGQKADGEQPRQAQEPSRPQIIAIPVPIPAPVPAAPAARGMDFDTFIRLQRGMSEGELLIRAGRPDHEALDSLGEYDRTYYYFPTVANPYTTVVRLRGGRIASLDRVKKF